MLRSIISVLFCLVSWMVISQEKNMDQSPFRQMYDLLPTANAYRTATGAPGKDYYQVTADYKINVTLDDLTQKIYGEEWVTFHNSSPDVLPYIWIQLDQNVRSKDSDTHKINPVTLNEKNSTDAIQKLSPTFDGGFKIDFVKDLQGKALNHTINKTMMRIDLPTPLKPNSDFSFHIKYWYNINDRMELGGRSGYEYFEEDDNYLYTIAQFFPRLCAYNDIEGWQNKQFLGSGEFTLIFGDYEVNITVPDDHLVAATGTLQNMDKVLTKSQFDKYKKATQEYNQPVIIATQEEAEYREKYKSTKTKTWSFKANNVRDFAFASSRKFIWDAMAVKINDKTSMAMSMYPKEGNPLWEKYSTKVVAHTLKTYSKYTIDYPYPVAWSINADRIGMEYPMICFNFGRCEKDGTYSERTKYGMIGVIIHEVGHNFFPMIINSDERQWTWMDEGLNTFVQYLSQNEFERNYPGGRGEPSSIVPYMAGDKSKIAPIMTNSESIFQFGNNAYAKPATALNILRETIMGRELFDYAFKEYARRWAFKQPYPADFFRTMEDASGIDLDWFWRGWFYTNDHVDLSIKDVQLKKVNPSNPIQSSEIARQDALSKRKSITYLRNLKDIPKTYNEIDTTLNDFYTDFDRYAPDSDDVAAYNKKIQNYSEDDLTLINSTDNFYEIEIERIGGLVMPIIYEITYDDGQTEEVRIPAEIWRKNETSIKQIHRTNKKITKIELDPYLETADIDTHNNTYPRKEKESRFEIFKRSRQNSGTNPMQKKNKRAEP